MRFSMLLTGILILAVAGLCFGQVERGKPADVKVQQTPPPQAQQAQTPQATHTMVKFRPDMKVITLNDGLQCLIAKADQIKAAYAEAGQSGCKKISIKQGTVYDCGYHPSAYYSKCVAAANKLKAILDGCGLQPPVHNPAPEGGWDMNPVTPGCNSLGITCIEWPA